VLATWFGLGPGHAEKRLALVVGNDRYQNLPAEEQLKKAVNDANAVGDALARIGFEVVRGENVSRQALVDSFDELTRRLEPGDTAFVFFAGHGVTLGGGNYILPSDVPNVEQGQETRLARASLGETDIVSDLQGRGARVAIVVLDSCRNNPFRRPGVRGVGGERGLGRIEPVRGVFTLYSAGIGQTALDRLGDADSNPNSVFTRVLVPALGRPGIHLGDLAVEVREEVARLAGTVGHDQRPAYYDETIGGRVYLAGASGADHAAAGSGASAEARPVVPQTSAPAMPQPCAAAERHWQSAEAIGTRAALEDHIARFPDCAFAGLARAKLATLSEPPVVAETPRPEGHQRPGSYWDLDGSLVHLEGSGRDPARRIYYNQPTETASAGGAVPGTLLFSGRRNGDRYEGTAYVLAARCGSFPYDVGGRVTNSDLEIVLTGNAPRIDPSTCRVTSYRRQTLTLVYRYRVN
jgi:hypothetical protein